MYTISNVLIANLTLAFEKFESKSLNLGIMGKKYQLSNLNEILPLYYFEGADFKSDFGFWKFYHFITFLIKINYFVFWFYILDETQDRHTVKSIHMFFLLKPRKNVTK